MVIQTLGYLLIIDFSSLMIEMMVQLLRPSSTTLTNSTIDIQCFSCRAMASRSPFFARDRDSLAE